jgi:hypothetical protein
MSADRAMFRYEIPVADGWKAISLGGDPVAVVSIADGAAVEFWAEDAGPLSRQFRYFRVFGTGHPLPANARWVGTCPRTPSGLVWHLFEGVFE